MFPPNKVLVFKNAYNFIYIITDKSFKTKSITKVIVKLLRVAPFCIYEIVTTDGKLQSNENPKKIDEHWLPVRTKEKADIAAIKVVVIATLKTSNLLNSGLNKQFIYWK